MKDKRRWIGILILLLVSFMISACGEATEPPKVDTVLQIPQDTEARQVKADRTGLDRTPCTLPSQEVKIIRNSYWETFIGSTEGRTMTYLSEVEVKDFGNCDKTRDVFIEDSILRELLEE